MCLKGNIHAHTLDNTRKIQTRKCQRNSAVTVTDRSVRSKRDPERSPAIVNTLQFAFHYSTLRARSIAQNVLPFQRQR